MVMGSVLVFAFAVSVGVAEANHGSSKSGHKSWGLEEKFFYKARYILKNEGELGLSEKQVDTLRTLKRETKKNLIQQKANIEVLAVDIKALLHGNPVDVNAITPLIEKKYTIKKEKAIGLVQAFAKLKSTLTEAQWKKMKELWKSK